MSASAPIIKIDDISKSFGSFKVLDGLSMQVMPGEKLALIGPSGSGKTTILRILMTLERIDGGHIQIDGEQLYHMERNGQLLAADERHLTRMRRKIGMVFQLFNLFPHKCVMDNVTLAPMLPKIMLFDEVTSALDPELVEEVMNVMRKLAAETDMTMLLVTHEMGFAHDFADRVLFFDRGRIVEEGKPDEIFRNPKQERTQGFLKKIIAAGHRV
ncbi:MAG: ATP-binding cassette domain-containing protein [Mesorhizobium sp.]|nr:MAG: ATP-binding cassette domain-containing protein [Mesorhizobium sp.]